MRTLRMVMTILPMIALTSSGMAETIVPVGAFRSVELRNGGHVTVRHGQSHRVTVLTGDPRYARARINGDLLVIDKAPDCPRGYRLQVEVVTPELAAVSVSNGGILQVAAFPAQAAIEARVEQGGMLDIRSMAVDAVDASVDSGGRIFTTPRQRLAGSVQSGGAITYWGNPRVEKSIRDGGVVTRGTAADATKPLSELGPDLSAIPPIPPVPPLPPLPPAPHHH